MKVLSTLHIAGKTILALDGKVLNVDASKVIVNGKAYDFEIAYDMADNIGVAAEGLECEYVDFVITDIL